MKIHFNPVRTLISMIYKKFSNLLLLFINHLIRNQQLANTISFENISKDIISNVPMWYIPLRIGRQNLSTCKLVISN